MPVKITDSIFMGDDVVAHVNQIKSRISSG